ncbi:MAG: hypothetical protein ACAI35_21875 [Candidatus Methylacidiphilales bacterium]|nr:hypothetical protein [Candidatus Methylacidiphilales bacterium]
MNKEPSCENVNLNVTGVIFADMVPRLVSDYFAELVGRKEDVEFEVQAGRGSL